jgi:transporter family protein
MWIIYALLSAFTAALIAILGKLGLSEIDSTLATTIRSIIMSLFLIIITTLLKKWSSFTGQTYQLKDWLLIGASGIAGASSWLFYFLALKQGPVFNVAALDRLSLAFVFLLSILILGESFAWQSVVGIALMIVGALLVIR